MACAAAWGSHEQNVQHTAALGSSNLTCSPVHCEPGQAHLRRRCGGHRCPGSGLPGPGEGHLVHVLLDARFCSRTLHQPAQQIQHTVPPQRQHLLGPRNSMVASPTCKKRTATYLRIRKPIPTHETELACQFKQFEPTTRISVAPLCGQQCPPGALRGPSQPGPQPWQYPRSLCSHATCEQSGRLSAWVCCRQSRSRMPLSHEQHLAPQPGRDRYTGVCKLITTVRLLKVGRTMYQPD